MTAITFVSRAARRGTVEVGLFEDGRPVSAAGLRRCQASKESGSGSWGRW
jgi:hypothetical protein